MSKTKAVFMTVVVIYEKDEVKRGKMIGKSSQEKA